MKTQIKFYTLSLLLSSSTLIAMEDNLNQDDTEIETLEEYKDVYKLIELMKEVGPQNYEGDFGDSYKNDPFLWACLSLLNNSFGVKQLKIIVKIIEKHIQASDLRHKYFNINWPINYKIDSDKKREITKIYMNLAKTLHKNQIGIINSSFNHFTETISLLRQASERNRIDWIEFLVSELRLNVNTINDDHSPLTLATEQNNFEAVEKLIELGADVNWGNHKPLRTSVSNKNLKITKLLLKHGATIKDEPKKLTTDKQDINSNKTEKKVTGLILRGSAKKVIDPEKIVDSKKQKSKDLIEFKNW